jgi:hypothetical protein
MRSKGGSLYEVLKSASRPSGNDGGAPTSPETSATASSEANSTLQERLAAYKAAKLAAANQPGEPASEPAPTKVSATTLVLEPDPTPIPATSAVRAERTLSAVASPASISSREEPEPTPFPSSPMKGPGERVVRLTYNTVLFSGLIVAGLLFISYAVGLHAGKSAATESTAEVVRTVPPVQAIPSIPPRPPVQAPPPAPKKEYAIRLGEWKTSTAQDRVKALTLADDPDLKKTLERAGHKNFEKAFINRGPNDVRMALYVDRFNDHSSEAAKAALTAMKNFRFKNTTPFDKAVFEEVQPK